MRAHGLKACTAYVLFAAAACTGGGDRNVQVRLSVDETSCASTAAENVAMPCSGSVGVWLLDPGGAVLDERCVPFAGPPERTLSQLPSMLAQSGVSFDVEGDRQVEVELAVYGPEGAGCPRAGTADAALQPIQFAHSEPITLSGSNLDIPLTLHCLQQAGGCDPDPGVPIQTEVLDLETLQPSADGVVTGVELEAVFGDGPAAQLDPLVQLEGGGSTWSGTVSSVPTTTCLATVVSTSNDYQYLSCEGESSSNGIQTIGYRTSLDAIAMTDVPDLDQLFAQGFVIGRVTTPEGLPVPAELVTSSDPGYSVFPSGEWFLAFRQDGGPYCCTQFSLADGNLMSSRPIPVFPGVASTVHLLAGP